MRNAWNFCLCAVVLSLALSAPGVAQTTATLSGCKISPFILSQA
jgi:hypothetical protein